MSPPDPEPASPEPAIPESAIPESHSPGPASPELASPSSPPGFGGTVAISSELSALIPRLAVSFEEGTAVDYESIDVLRQRHAAWRLLRAGNATLILSFLGGFFVEGNRGACSGSDVAAALDEQIFALNVAVPAESGEVRFPKEPRAYLEDWSASEAGYLRRFYPPGDDEVHYEVTPSFEKAYAWVVSLEGRSFVGTESRLHTVVELLRQIVRGTEADPDLRLADLRHRRDQLDAEIAAVEAGQVSVLDSTGVRDRYQQFSATARELLADFREVEENFRRLDRSAREKIASWDGSKGDLLARAGRQSFRDRRLGPGPQLSGVL